MAKNVWEVRSSFIYTSISGIILKISMLIIAVALLAQDANLNPKELIWYILKMHDMVWVKSLLCIGILAAAMSTADSNLHVASVLVAHDYTHILNWNTKHKLKLAHFCSLIITLIAIWMCCYEKDLLKLLLLGFNFYIPIVSVPFIMAIFGFRPAPKSVLIGMAAGVCMVAIFPEIVYAYPGLGSMQSPVFPAMVMNLLFLVGSHYLLPKPPGTGWVAIKDGTPLILAQQKKERQTRRHRQAWKNFSLNTYLQSLIPTRDISFVTLGLYCLVTQWFLVQNSSLPISTCLMLASSYLVIYPAIKEKRSPLYHQFITYLYPILMFVLLFLSISYMLPRHQYNGLVIRILFSNIGIALFMFPKRIVAIMVGLFSFSLHIINITWGDSWEIAQWLAEKKLSHLFHSCLIFLVGYWILLYWKQEIKQRLNQLLYTNQDIFNRRHAKVKALQYQYHAHQLMYKDGQGRILPEIIEEMESMKTSWLVASSQQKIDQWIDRLKGYQQFLAEDRYHTAHHLPLDTKTINIQQMVDLCIEKSTTLYPEMELLIDHSSRADEICCDPNKLQQIFLDGIRWMQVSNTILHLYLRDTTIVYTLDLQGVFKKSLPALAFIFSKKAIVPAVAASYQDELETSSQINVQDVHSLYHLSLSKLVEAHYGCLFMDAEKLTIIFPLNINEIRDQVMNQVSEKAETICRDTPESLAQEQKVTHLLVQHTSLTLQQVKDTLSFIKEAHKGQIRDSGAPYYTHPMAVAEILLEETQEASTILAALLHDVIEDTEVTPAYLHSKYGSEVVKIVAGVTHFADTFRKKKLNTQENEEKLRRRQDLRSVQVKIADRLHNMTTLQYRSKEKQQKIAHHTLNFYLPFARKMGIKKLADKLDQICQNILIQ